MKHLRDTNKSSKEKNILGLFRAIGKLNKKKNYS